MQDIADKLKDFTSRAGDAARKGLDTVKETAGELGSKMPDLGAKAKELGSGLSGSAGKAKDFLQANPTVAAMLLAGGGAGLLSGYLTSRQPEEEGESKSQRRMRILRNALLAGSAGAGAIGLGSLGLKRLGEAVPAGTQNPVEEKLTSPTVRALGGAGAAALGYSKGLGMDLEDFKMQALRSLSPDEAKSFVGASPDEIIAYAQKNKNFLPASSDFITRKIQGVKGPQQRKLLELLLGTTRAGRAGRLAGAGGLLLPEILGQAKDLVLQQ